MNKFIILISFLFIFFPPPEIPIPPDATIIADALSITTPSPTQVPTLYNAFSEEELDLLFRVVECEARGGSLESKINVASVIFNRVKTNWEKGDLIAILMKPRQFEVVTLGVYKTTDISEDTILACELAFEKDTVQGAVYFDCTDGTSWAAEECRKGNLIWVMRDALDHDFYRKPRKDEQK